MSVVLVLDFWVPVQSFREEFGDYLAATVLLAVSFVVQGYVLLPIIWKWFQGPSSWCPWFRKEKKHSGDRDISGHNFFVAANATIFLFMTGITILYCIRLVVYAKGFRQALPLQGRTVETSIMSIAYVATMSVAMQFVIYIVDFLMIYRCYIVIGDSQLWICIFASCLFVISIGASLMTLIIGVINTNSFSAGLPINERLRQIGYYTPIISTAFSVSVNVVVTIALVVRILSSHKKMTKLAAAAAQDVLAIDQSLPTGMTTLPPTPRVTTRRKNSRYKTTSALLVESALPSALCGLVVCILYPFVDNGISLLGPPRHLGYPKHSVRVLWFACTALAPQFIMVRVLKQRDTHTVSCSEETAAQGTSGIRFRGANSELDTDLSLSSEP